MRKHRPWGGSPKNLFKVRSHYIILKVQKKQATRRSRVLGVLSIKLCCLARSWNIEPFGAIPEDGANPFICRTCAMIFRSMGSKLGSKSIILTAWNVPIISVCAFVRNDPSGKKCATNLEGL